MSERLIALVDRLRPANVADTASAEQRLRSEIERLTSAPGLASQLGDDLRAMLALPHQAAFYAETGVRSAHGFWLELRQRIGERLLPKPADSGDLGDTLAGVFHHARDDEWVAAVDDSLWCELIAALGGLKVTPAAVANVVEAVRGLSYRLAGTALDRELLHADPALERHESPFLAQNAVLVPLLERIRDGGALPDADEVRDVDVLLDQCIVALDRVRRRAGENGISIRLTYLVARMRQLIARQRQLVNLLAEGRPALAAVHLLKELLRSKRASREVRPFIGESLSLLARNVTDHASRHGEHYVIEDRAGWWAMARSAAGGGVIIALMALIKLKIAVHHLPPLTEGLVFGLTYGLGFALIHLLGFTVATKQPAMTAAAIAATVEEARPRDIDKLGGFAQNVVRSQFAAILGNVGIAFPVACLLTWLWFFLGAETFAPPEKLQHMLAELDPVRSGALFFAAVAGVGLFLSGLVSGYFDNQARYHGIAGRIAAAPALRWLGAARARRVGHYLDEHYGAILGNLFFGMYLGLMGSMGTLTGLPIEIRHVAFASANLGMSLTAQGFGAVKELLPWAVFGVFGIALVNLSVSFTLALYVAMKSRRLGSEQIARLGMLMAQRFIRQPLEFFRPPRDRSARSAPGLQDDAGPGDPPGNRTD